MKIIHINQRHKIHDIEPSSEVFDQIVQSQLQVALELKKYPNCPILREGLYEDWLDASNSPMSDVAKMLFPEGLPESFHLLTSLQKDFFYTEGGVFTSFYLGEIPTVYKSIHKEAYVDFDKNTPKEKIKQFHIIREKGVFSIRQHNI